MEYIATADLLAPTIETLAAQARGLGTTLGTGSHEVTDVVLTDIRAAYAAPTQGSPMEWRAKATITLTPLPEPEPEPEPEPTEPEPTPEPEPDIPNPLDP